MEVPPRAVFLRTIWSELARLSSHLLWLGLMADAFGFESLFMQSFRIREKIVDMLEEMTGGRIILGVCRVGGVRRDVPNDALTDIVRRVKDLGAEMRRLADVFLQDDSVKHRLVGRRGAHAGAGAELGCVGPMMRASGISPGHADPRLRGIRSRGLRARRGNRR